MTPQNQPPAAEAKPHDADKKERFGRFMSQVLNHGALNLALGLGYRLELFEALSAQPGPATCEQLAKSAGLSARYLREWLGVMACGRVLELSLDASGLETYYLPPEHAAYLLRDSQPNLGVYTQETPLLTRCAHDAVLERFASGQGVDCEHYPDFQAFMAELADAKHQDTLIESFLPQVDEGRLVKRLHEGIAVCDLGCGSGLAALLMARAFPKSQIIGLDFSAQAIQAAHTRAEPYGLTNLSYEMQDAALIKDDPAFAARFDYVTAFDAIHDQSHPAQALAGVRHMLKPGGLFSMVDIAAGSSHAENLDHPHGAIFVHG